MMKDEKYIAQLISKFGNLESAASQRDDWINRIAHYAEPTLYNYKYDIGSTKGNLPGDIYDGTMVNASNTFSNGIYSYLTNPSSRWVNITVRDRRKLNIPGVRDWLQHVEETIYGVLSSTNFYPEIHQCYRSLVFGNCVIYREKDELDIVRYYSIPLTECYFERDHKRNIVAMWRRIKKTPLELVSQFPDTVSDKVREMAKKGNNQQYITVLHVVRPRFHRDMKKIDKENKKFESIYIDKDNKTLLEEGGYDKFPFFVGSFINDPSSPYAYGPGHLSLYDGKTLNQMMLTTIRAAQKQTDPPITIPHDGYIMPFLQDPGSINYRLTSDPRDEAKGIISGANFQVGMQMIQDSRDMIRQAFFVDLFLSITNTTKRMTVPELQERIAEKAPMLGPVIDNLTSGFLNYIIEDLVEVLAEGGVIDPAPEALKDSNYELDWLSPLAKAQRVSELNSIMAFGNVLATTMQMNPDAVDNVDFDELLRVASDVTGLKQTIMKEVDEVEELRKKRNEAIAAQNARQEQLQLATAAKDATQADKNVAEAMRG